MKQSFDAIIDGAGQAGPVLPERVVSFLRSFLAFSHGKIVSNDRHAPGIEIGRPRDTFRRVRVESFVGKLTVFVTDGHLPDPYGRELASYEVSSLYDTFTKAESLGVRILVQPYFSSGRIAAIVEFPGGSRVWTRPR
jgi:hypothetical protein